jgi:hypothetical protein
MGACRVIIVGAPEVTAYACALGETEEVFLNSQFVQIIKIEEWRCSVRACLESLEVALDFFIGQWNHGVLVSV